MNNIFKEEVKISSFIVYSEDCPVADPKKNSEIIFYEFELIDGYLIGINPNRGSEKLNKFSKFAAITNELLDELEIWDYFFECTNLMIEWYVDNINEFNDLNLLLLYLFNVTINENDKEYGTKGLANYCSTDNTVYISSANFDWEMMYTSRQSDNSTDIVKACLELRNLRPIEESKKLYGLKKLWFEKLNQLLIIYDYLKIRKEKAGYDYAYVKILLDKFSRKDLEKYIENIKNALNEYFDIF